MTEIRSLRDDDAEALLAFFRRVPEGDLTFYKQDVLDPRLIGAWMTNASSRRLVALDGDTVCGCIEVASGTAWSSHVGELRLVVDPAHRGRGVGVALARAGMVQALELGLRKLVVEAIADQEATIGLFNAIGFQGEALLRDHVRTHEGEYRDLIVLAHFVDDVWSEMQAVGLADELG